RRETLESSRHGPMWRNRIMAADWRDLSGFLAAIGQAVAPLCELRGTPEVSLAQCLVRLVRALEMLAVDHQGGLGRLYAGEDGEALVAVMRELIAGAGDFACEADGIPAVLDALILPQQVRPATAVDRSVAIWGVLEARLQDADLIV